MAAAIPSAKDPTTASSCRSGWAVVAAFGASTALLGLLFSLLAAPFVDLTLWLIFRRCASIAAALSLWLVARWQGRSVASYGLSAPSQGGKAVLSGLLLGALGLAVLLGAELALGACRIQITPDRLKLWRTVIGFLPAALLVSVLEELVFRGLILQHLLNCSKPLAVAVSSVLYSVVHLKTATLSPGLWLELGGLALLGAVLSLSYLRTGRLFAAVGMHTVMAYAARVNKLVIAFPNSPLNWLIGTNRLVNGIAGWLVLCGIAVVITRWSRPSDLRAPAR